MENQTCRKNIANRLAFSGHVSDINDFRGYKTWSATPDKQVLFLIGKSSQSKIAYNQIIRSLFSKHNVFRLQISVDNSFFGKCSQCIEYISDNFQNIFWVFQLTLGYYNQLRFLIDRTVAVLPESIGLHKWSYLFKILPIALLCLDD